MFLLEEFQGLLVPAVPDQGDIALDADMGRAGGLARRRASLADAECSGDGLGVLLENRPTQAYVFIVFVGKGNGTDLGAFSAARAFKRIDIPRIFVDFCGEIPRLAFETEYFSICQKLNVQMTADLDQFW